MPSFSQKACTLLESLEAGLEASTLEAAQGCGAADSLEVPPPPARSHRTIPFYDRRVGQRPKTTVEIETEPPRAAAAAAAAPTDGGG
jgi:hypothetical protein